MASKHSYKTHFGILLKQFHQNGDHLSVHLWLGVFLRFTRNQEQRIVLFLHIRPGILHSLRYWHQLPYRKSNCTKLYLSISDSEFICLSRIVSIKMLITPESTLYQLQSIFNNGKYFHIDRIKQRLVKKGDLIDYLRYDSEENYIKTPCLTGILKS